MFRSISFARVLAMLSIASVAILAGLPQSPAEAAPTTGTITGFVYQEGADIAFAFVTLTRVSDGAVVGRTLSGVSGYRFKNVAPGDYIVTADGGPGSGTDSAAVTVVAGQTHEVDLTLPDQSPEPIPFP